MQIILILLNSPHLLMSKLLKLLSINPAKAYAFVTTPLQSTLLPLKVITAALQLVFILVHFVVASYDPSFAVDNIRAYSKTCITACLDPYFEICSTQVKPLYLTIENHSYLFSSRDLI